MIAARRTLSCVWLACTVLLGACLDANTAAQKNPLPLKNIQVSEGSGLETACMPTGVEMCFDAIDNNCNGVLDEGCGLHTGILQFTAAWAEPEADVDLNVYDTSGELARVGEPTLDGLVKDRDCPRVSGECQGQNVENVYLSEGEPKRGRYRVVIRLDKLNGAAPPIRVRLGVRAGQKSYGMNVSLSMGGKNEEAEFSFTL